MNVFRNAVVSSLALALVVGACSSNDEGGSGSGGAAGGDASAGTGGTSATGGTTSAGGAGGTTSAGGTGGTTSTGGSGGGACLPAPGDCMTCQDEEHGACECDSALQACAQDPACNAMIDCVFNGSGTVGPCQSLDVPGAECVNGCAALNPNGAALYIAFESCLYCNYCAADCMTDDYCAALGGDAGVGTGGAGGSGGGAAGSGGSTGGTGGGSAGSGGAVDAGGD